MAQPGNSTDPSTTRSEPRTPTGRAILLQDFRGNSAYAITRREILAIESEAAAPPLPTPAPTLEKWPCARCGEPIHLRHLNSPPGITDVIDHDAVLPAPASTLDVMRLAAALDNVDRDYERGWTPAHYARAVAAEYARLQPTPRTIR